MNRNQNSHFSKNPQVDIHRSRFDRSHSVKLSFNVGELVPFFCDEVLPGDTFQVSTSKLVRMQTLAAPIMDNIYLDTYYFFVPNRLVWDDWQRFMGENEDTYWTNTYEVNVPKVKSPTSTGWDIGTIADYFGIPTGVKNLSVNHLPFRAYGLIWNEWFRDENLQTPQYIKTTTGTSTGSNLHNDDVECAIKGGFPLPVCKFKDYFTSALPSPQKGPDVLVPLGLDAPVITKVNAVPVENFQYAGVTKPTSLIFHNTGAIGGSTGDPVTGDIKASTGQSYVYTSDTGTGGNTVYPANLWADLQNATAASINQLRLAFQIQKIYEKDARGGTRYIEILKSHFGVTSPDSRLQRPEYLGGNRMMINVNQVVQQSESATTPQGTTTAYSLTVDNHSDFTQSFVEHGFVIGVMCARYDHTYQNGLEKFWSRKNRFDYYFPALANIGEQPILNKEIYASGEAVDDSVFGYQEAWADYRYKPNRVAGEMRSNASNSLDVWHLADDYDSNVDLSAEWIKEDKTNVDRALAVTSDVSNQLFGDFYIKNLATRPMPLFSIPGLIDHH